MSLVDYAAMSDQELRRYFLAHRDDDAAFQAYLARRRERLRSVVTMNFDGKIQSSISQQMAECQSHSEG
ncbi:MAG: hypothetical protein AAF892_09365 [Cyanobacteria bacterium P01_D01_bin.71]